MSQVTIQCRLVAPEATRRHLWKLASEKNTPLINELIQGVVNHPDFEAWRQKGRHPVDIVRKHCKQLKSEARFSGQPSRFYMSAEKVVDYIFKSWFKIQNRLQKRLSGKQDWLTILKSDDELVEICGQSLEKIKQKAVQILKDIERKTETSHTKETQTSSQKSLTRSHLFKRYRSAKQPLTQCASAYLLKNSCRIPKQSEDSQKFSQRRRKSELQVQRLQEQLEARVPKGRDLTEQDWLSTLLTATSTVPKDNQEHKRWQDRLLAKPHTIPFPILFETNEDLSWSLHSKGRLCVHFNGLREYTFQIYCDQRQLSWFKRFLEDQQTKRASKNQHSSALFTLRSACLSWQKIDDKDHPWDNHYLTLSCTVDKRLWSAEGTDQVRQEKAADTAKILTRLNAKDSLSKTQAAYAKRLNSMLDKLESPFDRPSQPRYQGQSQIIAGLSLGWDSPLTLAIWKADTQEILIYRSLRQLLAKDYPLFLKQRREQQKQSHRRHKAQRQGKENQFGTSNLGQHIDRLLAKAVVNTAKQYGAGSIAIPALDNIRDILQVEIDARAEQKIPGYLEAQKRYTKQYKSNIHKWSYGRLLDQITSKANQENLAIEKSKQPLSGTSQAKAKFVAINAYESRKTVRQN
ncbi:type V CRISPR-associated protein Cas12k [Leptothoe spongobia]|uniref:Type V CRISPR-associated protein Cas12k n=1 Tax=Leptothoe spongobia TAU-MAC 1115 TaxID=1967444 RepID=A0A947DDJ8_9CYAN|nr:type V CRISPR-associated protein Cas12k [Leptothoe spongobia]MBT9314369.1 type V CRISPR-associated protein Cas12k [Leptothoe spongobia TAU-MAC 1115]